ncbi:MAG: hypothetical protein MJA83_16995, partial [Gammaproteobacteria bacterium]|nr:hypothetical protein [Gammaproteobacteria bacterium]
TDMIQHEELGLLVVDSEILVAINPVDGTTTLMSMHEAPTLPGVGTGPGFWGSRGIALLDDNHVLLTSDHRKAVIKVVLRDNDGNISGDRVIVSDDLDRYVNPPKEVGKGVSFVSPRGIAAIDGRALVADWSRDAIVTVDIETGDRDLFAHAHIGEGSAFLRPELEKGDIDDRRSVAVRGELALVADMRPGEISPRDMRALIGVDLTTGDRQVISVRDPNADGDDDDSVGVGVGFRDVEGIAFEDETHALIASKGFNTGGGRLFSVDLERGHRSIVSDDDDGDPKLNQIYGILVDGNRALVTDRSLHSVTAVELHGADQGKRTILSDADSGGPAFNKPVRISEFDGIDALVVNRSGVDRRVLKVNLTTGERGYFSGDTRGEGPDFSDPVSLVFDSNANRALVLDINYLALLEINSANGDRKIISDNYDNHTPPITGNPIGAGVPMIRPVDMAFDADQNRVVVMDNGLNALISIDLGTGDRRIISK